MVRITEELVRKKSEHNELIINSLEELSLHQEDVEKIEHIHNWCKELQILYLQSNLISKIENLNKLKKLEYLNLAINNIEKIENLERCESLEKLDLTLNFIGDLESVRSLQNNIHLRRLYLVGNPCTDYEGYRQYVLAALPQLEDLDNTEITRSERIKAQQMFEELESKIQKQQDAYYEVREEQRARLSSERWDMDNDTFWKSKSEHAPETRREISRRTRQIRNKDKEKECRVQKSLRMFNKKDGRPLNINQAKIKFRFNDEDPMQYVLDLQVYKYMDTTLIDVDVQPIFVKVTIKGKVFQFALPEEVLTDKSTAQRSQITGHLLIKMPRVNYKPKAKREEASKPEKPKEGPKKTEFLDVKEKDYSLDFSKIVENSKKPKAHFVDNPDVPPLEFG